MNPTNNPRGLDLPWQMNPEYVTHPGSLIGQMYILQLRNGGRMGGWHTAPPKDEAELQHRMEVLRENHGNDFRRIVELAKEAHDGTTGGNNGSDEWKDVPLQRHPPWYEELLRETGQNPPKPKSWREKGRDKVSAGAHMRGGGLSHSKSREMSMYVPMSGAPSARPPSYRGPFESVRSMRSYDRDSGALGTRALLPRNQSRQSRVRSMSPRNQTREHRVQSTSPVCSAPATSAPSSRSHERERRRSTPPAPSAVPVQREPSAREKGRSPTPSPAPTCPQVKKAPRTVAPRWDLRQKVAKEEEMRYKERDGQTARGGDHIRGYEPKKDRDEGFPKTIGRF